MLTIYGKASSINVRKVLWTCAELDLPFERLDYGSGFISTQTPEFLSMNPNGMVPVIQDDHVTLWESNTICRYLASKANRVDLLPTNPIERARIEQWMDWQATELNNSWRYPFMARVRNHPDFQTQTSITAGIASWNHHMRILDAQLSTTGAFVSGDTFTLADIVIGLSVNRWLMSPIEHATLPAVNAYYSLLSQRDGFLTHGRNGLV